MSGVPGLLSASELALTASQLASLQVSSGQIPWFRGGHCDPWNHVEAAMALTITGYRDEARSAYRWLASKQLGDGSWFNYYLGGGVKDTRLDTNVCAYIATGIYHYLLATDDIDFAQSMWSHVERATEFVLRWQLSDGTIRWSLDSVGRPETYALLTGSSSIFHSLRCAVALAQRLGFEKPSWEFAAGRLGHAVAHHPGAFAPKNEFAMDWYYPCLLYTSLTPNDCRYQGVVGPLQDHPDPRSRARSAGPTGQAAHRVLDVSGQSSLWWPGRLYPPPHS